MQEIKGKNKVWNLEFDLDTAARIKEKLPEYDLFAMQEKPDKFQHLLANPFTMCDLLVVALEGQFDAECGIDSKTQLQKDFNAAAMHSARAAAKAEFLNFIPQERKDATSQLLDTASEIEIDMLNAMADGVKSGELKQKAEEMIKARIAKFSDTVISAG